MSKSETAQLTHAVADHWNNLLWAIQSPDLAPQFSLPWLPSQRRQALLNYFLLPSTKNTLRKKLEQTLQTNHSHRLGIYFENLWDFVFQHHPDYELIRRNLPIRIDGKTLGELDFVVRHIPDNSVEHWEVAVKFYLQVGDLWVGPGLRDRLDIKLARMRDHQLPFVQAQVVKEELSHLGIHLDRQWALMPGRLFSPLTNNTSFPADNFWWAGLTQFLDSASGLSWQWLRLTKQSWLADCAFESSHSFAVTSSPLSEAVASGSIVADLEKRGPICVAAMDDAEEISRGFIVPDDWLYKASQ